MNLVWIVLPLRIENKDLPSESRSDIEVAQNTPIVNLPVAQKKQQRTVSEIAADMMKDRV